MRTSGGFTLLETLITTTILVFGLAAMALMFSYTARTNISTRERTTATLLLYEKLEEFRSTSLADSIWIPGSYVDFPAVDNTRFIRQWQITDTTPRGITMMVFAANAGLTGHRMELIRAATLVGSTFQ